MYMMNSELKYVHDCWYCNAIIEAMKTKREKEFGLLSIMFRIIDIVKLVDGEDESMPRKMSRETAYRHIKELRAKEYLEDSYTDLKTAYGSLHESINSVAPILESIRFTKDTIRQMADLIDKNNFKYLSISLRASLPDVIFVDRGDGILEFSTKEPLDSS